MATRLRVLVVDPCEDAADSLGLMLNRWGCDVQVAYTGTEALKIAAYHRPHAVLVEPAMLEFDPAELVKRLRRRAILVAVTSRDGPLHRVKWAEAGFQFLVVKPRIAGVLRSLLDAVQRGRIVRRNEHKGNGKTHRIGSDPAIPCRV